MKRSGKNKQLIISTTNTEVCMAQLFNRTTSKMEKFMIVIFLN